MLMCQYNMITKGMGTFLNNQKFDIDWLVGTANKAHHIGCPRAARNWEYQEWGYEMPRHGKKVANGLGAGMKCITYGYMASQGSHVS